MITVALNTLKTKLLTNNPYFQNGYAGARKLDNGKIIINQAGEFIYVGLRDTEGNFFYIRFLDDIQPEAPDVKTVACFQSKMVIPLRFVSWVKNGNLEKILRCILSDIYSEKLNVEGYGKINIIRPSSILFDGEKIFQEETGKVVTPEKVTLLAIDFEMEYNFTIKNEACLDRDVCNPC